MDKKTEELIRGYLAKAEEKLVSVKNLIADGSYDDAVSRAYYAAFHAASALLLSEGLTADTHSGLVNLFGLHFVKSGKFDKKFGKYLSTLKENRENGDYEVFSAIDKETADSASVEAEAFVKEMKRYLSALGVNF
ncbi:hypothetical protein A2625_05935 [candidate division WOR-1 bacterium RIFCSPHIGHO2_01_FULL_53_15]|uniref:HEPN domain-containing protein n=1 Tax=candidate division WOR-1 bacterium RIFCSPHIGHO2_01_FULL_53_15 TaxID=1802564 RepID=A0A1F4Q0U2_UNCSA|nr:MAG: hypothetical protein A2625_05935 [candidate division WOR-1 bacterium RIFCSPHIGHO2_01_FULL_53_15]OGC13867.1 MAG: hypothetical protein A3D23_02285 [candidate division WOR-1 bacterium RIFCSPHIGHO2_02_FULL_53_26]